MSVMGLPVVAPNQKKRPPQAPIQPWNQSVVEKGVCLVTLAAREGKSSGIFCKVGSEITVLTSSLLIPSESVSCFATSEFFFKGGSNPDWTVKLNPQVWWEVVGGGMCVVGVIKENRPKYEDEVTPGLMVELEPLKICTDLREYPTAGEKVECIAHPFGMAKVRIDLWVESVDLEEGVMTFEREAGDGCHGAPIIYNGVCVAVLDQPGIGPKADKARLMNKVLPEKYHDDYDAEKEVMTYDSSRMSKVEFDHLMLAKKKKEEAQKGKLTKEEVEEAVRAVQQGNLESLIKMQYKVGMDAMRNWTDFNGRSLIHFCSFYSCAVSLAGLRRQGYNIHAKTKHGDTAVHIACYQGAIDCLKLLHKWGASLVTANNSGDRPAHKAALRGRVDILAFLHNSGVDIYSPFNGQGLTPLDLAKESGTWETVKLLEAAQSQAEEKMNKAMDDGNTSEILAGLHVPGFYKVPENWPKHMRPGPGTAENREIRTRESTRGKDSTQFDELPDTRLYLRAKTPQDSKRALGKVKKKKARDGVDDWFA
ncbi:hypothetical protein TrVE_jg2183 [Triparma verrucosa]|uniref:Uncharacterized protein n=1 Tax=Triparma verrucosa TaxID=1606542 RepID=A0A9W7KWI6_9STRA|nr:hypothetical protein TrVE_jg2183 [Triparma verrucosa]